METVLTRVFKMGPITLPDPDPSGAMAAEAVRDLYTVNYPHLADCAIDGPHVVGDRVEIRFEPPPVKTKG